MQAAPFPLRLAIVALPLALAACWGGDTDRRPVPQSSVTSQVIPGMPATIETVVVDPLPVAAAHLVTGDGTEIAATEILRDKDSYTDEGDTYPHVAVGAQGGSQQRVTTGIGIQFPFLGSGGQGPSTRTMTTSTITFRIPDMAAYDEDWQRWILHIDLDDGTNHRTIETLPPKPPR